MIVIYLVGLDVFCFDVEVYGEIFKVFCVEFGFVGFYLFDYVLFVDICELVV